MSTTVRATLVACIFAMSGMASAAERIIPPAVPLEIELSSVYRPFRRLVPYEADYYFYK